MGRRPPDSNFYTPSQRSLHNSRGLNVRSLLSLCGAGILQHRLRLALFASSSRPAAPAPIAAPSAGGPRLRLALFASAPRPAAPHRTQSTRSAAAPRPAAPAPIAAPSAGGPRCASSPRGRHAFRSDVLHHPRGRHAFRSDVHLNERTDALASLH